MINEQDKQDVSGNRSSRISWKHGVQKACREKMIKNYDKIGI